MSTCISSHGEYSEHVPDEEEEFVCGRCFVVDEGAMRAEIQRLRADRPPVTDNARAETTTATDEDAALVIHEAQCVENEHGDHCIFWEEDHQSAQALADAGLLARPTPSRDQILLTLAQADVQPWPDGMDPHTAEFMYGKQADAVLALLEGGTDE